MYDQEPLDWDLYSCPDAHAEMMEHWENWGPSVEFKNAWNKYYLDFNLKSTVLRSIPPQIYDQVILVHSEKNSKDLEKYEQNGFVCVHYWAHGVIARDWYRFAQFDSRLNAPQQSQHKFLIYCRDWSHRREYRLKFLEMLVENKLHTDSLTSVMHNNSDGVHYSQHKFSNSNFDLADPAVIAQFKNNNLCSTSSADYDYCDFVNTEISVVLETVFDDSRVHLTEKTLRPIACGHSFLLAAGPGALEYVKSYGFKTFSPWIDESYDLELDSLKRMEKIIQSMKKIQNLQGTELQEFSQAIKSIAEFNKKYFFSEEFFNVLQTELKDNLKIASKQVRKSQGKNYLGILKIAKENGGIDQLPFRRKETLFLRQLRQSYRSAQSNSQEDQSV